MITQWWDKLVDRFINKVMLMARDDSNVSYKDYREMLDMYEEIYGKKFQPNQKEKS